MPLVGAGIEAQVYACIAAKCRELGCEPLAINGVADHVHVLLRFKPAVPVATLVREMKGGSSYLVATALTPGIFFKWQSGYGAFTVDRERVAQLTSYIRNQKDHHAEQTLMTAWEMPNNV
ncbi:MAG: transposase [Chloroflexota bacterium]|nr:transposase [Chloroflexota bacterium]